MIQVLKRLLTRLFPSPRYLCLLGFCAPQIWMHLVASGADDPVAFGSTAFHGASAVLLLALAFFYARRPQALVPLWPTFVAVAAMCLYPVWLLAPVLHWIPEMALLALGGLGCAWFFASWFGTCCGFGLGDAVCYLLLSFALAAACRLVIVLVPERFGVALVLVMTVSLAALEPFARRVARESRSQPGRGAPVPSPHARLSVAHKVLILTELVLYSFVLVLMSNVRPATETHVEASAWNNLLRIVFALMLFAWFGLRGDRKTVLRFVQVVLCLVIAAILGATLLGERAGLVMAGLVSFARFVVLMLLTVTSAEVALTEEVHPFAAFGVSRGVYDLSVAVGALLVGRVIESLGGVALPLNTLFFILSCLFLALILRALRTFDRVGEESWTPPDGTGEGDSRALAERREALASRYGLTDREREVFVLLCEGRGKAHIAEVLSISENTVRHHCKNIYAKLGVHAREELMDLVGKR